MNQDFVMTVTLDDGDPTTTMVVGVGGDFDAARVPEFDRRTTLLPEGVGAVVVDLCRVTVVDSSGLGALVRLQQRCAASGVGFTTLIGKPYQRELMHVTGLTDVLGVRETPGPEPSGETRVTR